MKQFLLFIVSAVAIQSAIAQCPTVWIEQKPGCNETNLIAHGSSWPGNSIACLLKPSKAGWRTFYIYCGADGTGTNDLLNFVPQDFTVIVYGSTSPPCDGYSFTFSINPVFRLFADADGDHFGNPLDFVTCLMQKPQTGYVTDSTDCNDSDNTIYPDAPEFSDGKDNNCNGQIDETFPPQISINDKSIIEGNSGTQTMKFIVSLNHHYVDTISVKIATADSTATNGSDYTGGSGILKFLPGQMKKQIPITVKGDTQPEQNERFKVILSSPVNATIIDSLGIGSIRNNDPSLVQSTEKDESSIANNIISKSANIAKIWPNPATNLLNVELIRPSANIASIQFYNLSGNVLREWKFSASAKQTNQQLNIRWLAKGIYTVVIKDDKGTRQSQRIIISR